MTARVRARKTAMAKRIQISVMQTNSFLRRHVREETPGKALRSVPRYALSFESITGVDILERCGTDVDLLVPNFA